MIFRPSARSMAQNLIYIVHAYIPKHTFIGLHTYMHTYIYTYTNNWMNKKENNDHKITKPYNINREASSKIFHRVEAVLNIRQSLWNFVCVVTMAYHQMVGWRKTSDLLETFTLREGPPYYTAKNSFTFRTI